MKEMDTKEEIKKTIRKINEDQLDRSKEKVGKIAGPRQTNKQLQKTATPRTI